jgi:hypothetical protein
MKVVQRVPGLPQAAFFRTSRIRRATIGDYYKS